MANKEYKFKTGSSADRVILVTDGVQLVTGGTSSKFFATDGTAQEISGGVGPTGPTGATGPTGPDGPDNFIEQGTIIPSGADLNTYTTLGSYYSESAAKSATLINTPITGCNFKLIVLKTGSYITQKVYSGYINEEYTRVTNAGDTWTDWSKVIMGDAQGNIISTLNLGTTASNQVNLRLNKDFAAVYFKNTAQNPDTTGMRIYGGDDKICACAGASGMYIYQLGPTGENIGYGTITLSGLYAGAAASRAATKYFATDGSIQDVASGPTGPTGATGPTGPTGPTGLVAIGVIGTGNAVTGATLSGSTLTLQKDASYLSKTSNDTSTGTITAVGFYESSDKRLKNIHNELDLDKAYQLLDKCSTIIYDLKTDTTHKEQIGMIAQEVQEFFPEIVSIDEHTGLLSLDYSRLSVILLRIIKDLVVRINKLEK